jgi:cold shock CspA family protein
VIGHVKLILREKGYGFISTEAGDFFFHGSQVIGQVQRGDVVEFWLGEIMRHGSPALVAVEVQKHEEEQLR